MLYGKSPSVFTRRAIVNWKILEYSFILIMVLLTVSGQFCIKKGVAGLRFDNGLVPAIGSCVNIFLLIGFLMTMVAPFFYIFALKKIELSRAFAFSSANYIFVVLGSRFFFKEHISFVRWVGVIMIAAGIVLFGIET